MNDWQKNTKEEKEIDLWRFVEVLLKRFWVIVLAAVIFAVGGFLYTKLCVKPMYRTHFKAYIKNRVDTVVTDQNDTTPTGDLNASIGMMYLYNEVIRSRSVLVAAAQDVNLNYGYGTLSGMVTTELPEKASLIKVYVSADNPETAVKLAMAIANQAKERGQELEPRSSMEIVDDPVAPTSPYAPQPTRNAVIAALIGGVLVYALFVVIDLINDRVKSGEDLEHRYGVVVVGRIPDMNQMGKGYRYKYRYSYRRNYYGKGYGYRK